MALALWLLVAGAGCAGAPHAAAPAWLTDPEVARAWATLYRGGLDEAEATFTAWREGDGARTSEGLLGGLTVAMMRRDEAEMRRLLDQVAEVIEERPEVLIVAANVALSLDSPGPYIGLVEQACALTEGRADVDDTRQICAGLALHRAAPTGAECARGCEQGASVPMGLVGSVPVVMLSVQGQPPAPFIIDTGASTSVVTPAYASRIGLNPLEATDFTVLSSGGAIPTRYALASIAVGEELTLASVPVALLELPIDGVAGILSPQDSLRDFVVTLDFRAMRFGVEPSAGAASPGEGWVEFPMIRRDGNPYLMVQVGDRPERPMLVDTGASHTRLEARLEAMGSPLERSGQTVSLSAGGEVKTWTTSGSVQARSGDLVWTMEQPRIYEPVDIGPARNLGRFGLLGMDMFIGRALRLDVQRRTLGVHRSARLAPWAAGSYRTLRVWGSQLPQPFEVREEVIASEGGVVTLDVLIKRPDAPRYFRIETPDTWSSRGAWMATRPVKALWDLSSGQPVEEEARKAVLLWLPAMIPFETSGAPTVAIEPMTIDGEERICARLEMGAVARLAQGGSTQARARFWECAGSPWRSARMEVVDAATGELLWGFEQVP